ncbi:MAG: hypothetical protein ACK5XF_03560 [Neisseriaceae bacterium]
MNYNTVVIYDIITQLLENQTKNSKSKEIKKVIDSYKKHVNNCIKGIKENNPEYKDLLINKKGVKTVAYNSRLHNELGHAVQMDLKKLGNDEFDSKKLDQYNQEFKKINGFTPAEYAELFPCTIIFNPVLQHYAKDYYTYMTPQNEQFDLKKELLASRATEPKSVKCGAIVFQPTPFVFHGPLNKPPYIKKEVFGYGIDVLGVVGLPKELTFDYYYEMYTSIIKEAIKNDSIQHLILNSVGDNAYSTGTDAEECKSLNASAMATAIIDLKNEIKESQLRVTLLDFTNKFETVLPEDNCKMLEFDFKVLRGSEEGSLQSHALTQRISEGEIVALVNATDIACYGGNFLSCKGDHTVEERIRHQIAPYLQYDVRYSLNRASIILTFIRNNKINNMLGKFFRMHENDLSDDSNAILNLDTFKSLITTIKYALQEMLNAKDPDNFANLKYTLQLCNQLSKLIQNNIENNQSASLISDLNKFIDEIQEIINIGPEEYLRKLRAANNENNNAYSLYNNRFSNDLKIYFLNDENNLENDKLDILQLLENTTSLIDVNLLDKLNEMIDKGDIDAFTNLAETINLLETLRQRIGNIIENEKYVRFKDSFIQLLVKLNIFENKIQNIKKRGAKEYIAVEKVLKQSRRIEEIQSNTN